MTTRHHIVVEGHVVGKAEVRNDGMGVLAEIVEVVDLDGLPMDPPEQFDVRITTGEMAVIEEDRWTEAGLS